MSGSVAPQPERASLAFDLSASVSTDGERGLLDMELLRGGDRVAVSYTEKDGSVVLHVLRLGEAGLIDDLPSPIVLRLPHPIAGHNGGGLALGDNSDLFLSLGDMDSRHYDLPLAQDPESALGSVLLVPAEALEPDAARPIDPLGAVVAKGLRNPWRIALDPGQDLLWIGDVGESSQEEISALPLPTTGTIVDFGWPRFEGTKPFQRSDTGIAADPIPPVFEYEHSAGRCSIVLGGAYRGEAVAALENSMVLGDFCSGDVLAAEVDDASIATPTARHLRRRTGRLVRRGLQRERSTP
ncbi:MAG: PQQ-dependent sugar dehydrogenase [Microthrixaceae bacterium]|nr:PQQ-dependent sugar dehydrogenase [Microthrixaceae bacterium]